MVDFEGRAACGANREGFGDEAGFTLIELLVALSILLAVLGGIMTPLVSATRSEADLQSRFKAQELARLALTAFQRDVHCASAVSPTSGTVGSVSLTLSSGCESGSTSVTWCAVANGSSYDLWRVPTTTCTTSTTGSRRLTQSLTGQTLFTPDATTHVGSPVTLSVKVAMTVKTARSSYKLTTLVYSRTGTRQ